VGSVLRVAVAILVVVVLSAIGLALSSVPARASTAGASVVVVSGSASPSGGSPSAESSACSAVLADNPEANSSLFQEACNEPEFMAAVQEWGASNFTYASGGGDGYSDFYYTFEGIVACQNASDGTQCQQQEWWVANETTNSVSGPFYSQYPEICLCAEQPAPSSGEATPTVWWIVAAGGLFGGALTVGYAIRRRSMRSRGSSAESSAPPSPPREPPGPSN
jgi:hypothetical protein